MHRGRAPESSEIELPGPWSHRYVSANGARFHIAESLPLSSPRRSGRPPEPAPTAAADQPPLVLLLHGFPEFWWAWRHQLPTLADAGYHAVAMDLRGYGASDKPPRGYDPLTLAADVTGVIRSLGAASAFVVGHGWGGYVAWTAATSRPDCVRGLCAVAAPHPRVLTSPRGSLVPTKPVRHMLAMQLPWLPERRIAHSPYVGEHLSGWAAPSSGFPSPEEVSRYQAAFALWPSPHCALEYHRWLFRSRLRADGRAFARLLRRPVVVPVNLITGADDPADPAHSVASSARHVSGDLSHHRIADAGHFPHEERPTAFTGLLLDWLSQCTATGRDPVV